MPNLLCSARNDATRSSLPARGVASDLVAAGFSGDQEVVSPPDPVAGRELGEQRLVETARRLGVEILDGGVLPEVGKLEPRDEPPAFALDEEAEPLLECERSNSGLLPLLLERFGHADETEGDQPVVCGMWKHVSFLSFVFHPRLFFACRRLRASRGTRSSGSCSVVVATPADVGVPDRGRVRRVRFGKGAIEPVLQD